MVIRHSAHSYTCTLYAISPFHSPFWVILSLFLWFLPLNLSSSFNAGLPILTPLVQHSGSSLSPSQHLQVKSSHTPYILTQIMWKRSAPVSHRKRRRRGMHTDHMTAPALWVQRENWHENLKWYQVQSYPSIQGQWTFYDISNSSCHWKHIAMMWCPMPHNILPDIYDHYCTLE